MRQTLIHFAVLVGPEREGRPRHHRRVLHAGGQDHHVRGLQAGHDAETGIRVVPPGMVRGQMVSTVLLIAVLCCCIGSDCATTYTVQIQCANWQESGESD